jgi:hypothetical protein
VAVTKVSGWPTVSVRVADRAGLAARERRRKKKKREGRVSTRGRGMVADDES